MSICDICAAPGEGTHVGASQIREAVFDRGFNPFSMGLFPMVTSPGYFEHWKNTVVANDVGDWNLCARCLAAVRPYFSGAPAPKGIHQAAIPVDPGPTPTETPGLDRAAAARAIRQVTTGKDEGYVPGRDPLVDMMVAPIFQELEKNKPKPKSDDLPGCLLLIGSVIAAFGFHLVYGWGFWASAGAGLGASIGVMLLGALIWDLLFPKKKRS